MKQFDFPNLFAKEAMETIEGLTGVYPKILLKESELALDVIIGVPTALVRLDFVGEINGSALVILPATLATAIGDMMLGGDRDNKEDMTDEDIDCTKEIVDNIVGAINTTISSELTDFFPNFKILAKSATFIKNNEILNKVDLSALSKMYTFSFKLDKIGSKNFKVNEIDSIIMLVVDEEIDKTIEIREIEPILLDYKLAAIGKMVDQSVDDQNSNKNIELVKDVKVEVKVRIGQKTLSIEELKSLKTNDLIELDQRVNDPLEILVNNQTIGFGEVVIVDGNFGVQITFLGDRASFNKARNNVNY